MIHALNIYVYAMVDGCRGSENVSEFVELGPCYGFASLDFAVCIVSKGETTAQDGDSGFIEGFSQGGIFQRVWGGQ